MLLIGFIEIIYGAVGKVISFLQSGDLILLLRPVLHFY